MGNPDFTTILADVSQACPVIIGSVEVILLSNLFFQWEPKIKPSRMLFLHMTDGPKSIQAMEYQSIPCLNQSTAPGTKVVI